MKKEKKNPVSDEKEDEDEFKSNRISRGGDWNYHPDSMRASSRYSYDPAYRYAYIGFRIVRNRR